MTARKTTSKPLSALRLKNMKPGATVADTQENTGLRVTRSSAGWRYRYRFKHPETGKLAELTLFTRNAAALAGARVLFANLKAQRRADEVPKLPVEYARAPEPEKTQVPNLPTVADIVTVYLRDHVYPRRKLKGAKETDRVLTNHVVATIGDLPAENLDRQTVLGLVKNQISAGHHAQAGVVLRELDAAIEFAIGDTLLPDDFINPAQLAKRSLQQRKTRLAANRRQRYLTDDEIKAFLAWLPISAFSRNHRYALALTLETGCRSGETIAAEWRHINLDAGIWHPPETKTGTPRQVKLPRQTVEWLSAARLTDAGGTHLCPSPNGGHVQQKSISEAAWHIRKAGKMLDIPSWTAHDLRRTARTGLAGLGCPPPIAEALLGHTKGGTVAVHDSHQYFDEGGEWLQRWADHLDTLRTAEVARPKVA